MSSRPAARLLGVQTPHVELRPAARRSDVDDAAFLSSRYGLSPDDWQTLVLKAWLGIQPDGQWAARRCGLAVSRQNGKNAVLEVRELFGMVVLGEKFLHTAHEVKTARKAFTRLRSFFENRDYPELAALVRDVRQTNGQEAVILNNGGSVEFVARSKNSGRGYTVDVLVVDEAQEFSEDALEALLPTISSAPLGNPQTIYTGTPPGPKANGDIFTRLRGDGLEGKDRRLSWHEWSCDPDADLDEPANWMRANPALGIRLQWDVVEAERGSLSDAGFGRERLGMWDDASSNRVVGADVWAEVADLTSLPKDRFALAVDVSPDRMSASVALAGQRADGLWHVELDQQKNGAVGWLVPWIVRRCENNNVRAVVIDGMSPAASIIDELAQHKIRVTTTSAREMAQACGTLYDGVMAGWLRHTDQAQVNVALSVARRRPLGDAWAWNRKNAHSDITPLVACTLALWGAQQSTVKKPSRSGRPRRVVTG
jgi:phage terminase large subunit-like protein